MEGLRASCETAWLDEWHVAHVAAWIGHRVKVQRDCYAQITDGHFEMFNSHAERLRKKKSKSRFFDLGRRVGMR